MLDRIGFVNILIILAKRKVTMVTGGNSWPM